MKRTISLALAVASITFFFSVIAATVIYLKHPVDPDSEGIAVGLAAALWPFLLCPLAILACIVLGIFDWKRGIKARALIAVVIAILSFPTVFAGYELNQKPWLSPAAQLRDSWPDVRSRGAERFGEARDPEGIPYLVSALNDSDKDVRAAAASALGKYGRSANAAIPALVKALDDEDWFVACEAGEALGSMRGLQGQVLPPLVARFSDTRDSRSWCATRAVAGLGPEAAQALPALLKQMSVNDPNVRSQACETLGSIGRSAAAAVPQLQSALKDDNEHVREAAREALTRIQSAN